MESIVAAVGDAHVAYYRTSAGAEVNLVIERGGNRRHVIEIKRSMAPAVSKGFWSDRDDVEARDALVIYSGEERMPLGDRAEALGLRDAMNWVRARAHEHS